MFPRIRRAATGGWTVAGVMAVAVALVLSAIPSNASDHLEAPLVQQDGRTDINDVYAFQSPANPDNTVLIMTVNPGAGVLSPTTFDTGAEYRFNIDNDGDARLDRAIRVNFSDGPSGQELTVTGATGTASGKVGEEIALPAGGRIVAGLYDDPFFFDLQAFQDQIKAAGGSRTFCDGQETDFFAGLDTSAIVIELPSSAITGDTSNIGVWGETEGDDGIIDSAGRPAIATVLVQDGREDMFNMTKPHRQNALFGADMKATLLFFSGLDGSGYTDAEAQGITDLLLPDILTLDTSSADSFVPGLNGRTPADDVIDLELVVVTGGLGANGSPVLTGDCVDANDKAFPNTFPYLAAASAPQGGDLSFAVTTGRDGADVNVGDGVCADADGECTLRAAVQEGNMADSATIQLRSDLHWLTIAGAGEDASATGDLDIVGDITIVGGNGSTVATNGGDRHLDVLHGASLTMDRVVLRDGVAPEGESGGSIRNYGMVDLTGVVLTNNAANNGAGASGGAILNAGVLNGSGLRITFNDALRAGGGIEATAGSTTDISDSWLARNSAGPMPGNGGALHITGDGIVNMSDSTVRFNEAASEGGGLWNSVGTMTVTNTLFQGNEAHGDAADTGGGSLFNDGGVLNVVGGKILDSKADGASGSGGAVFNNAGVLNIDGTNITNNRANRAGGGIEALGGETTLTNVRFLFNRTGEAPGNGAALHLTGAGIVTATDSKVTGGWASNEGGGFWNSAAGTMVITNTDFNWNRALGDAADNGGGAVYNDGGDLTINGGRYQSNRAQGTSGSGGAVLNNGGMTTINGAFFGTNTANRAGGAIEAVEGTTILDGVTMATNRAGNAPGNGGGLHLSGAGDVDIANSSIRFNRASNEGGGIWNSSTGTMTVTNTVFDNNRAPLGPDTFNQDGGTLTIN